MYKGREARRDVMKSQKKQDLSFWKLTKTKVLGDSEQDAALDSSLSRL